MHGAFDGRIMANLNAIRAGEQDMGIVQSNQQYKALKGEGDFAAAGPNQELRAVFAVHPESFTVMARKDAGIKTFDDLKGKRVNIGNPGSGQRATMEVLMKEKGWDSSVFKLASELKPAEQAQALCDNKIDAMLYFVGHPNGSIQEAASSCEAVLVTVAGKEVDKLVAEFPYYALSTIPGGMYPNSDQDTQTFGVAATLVFRPRFRMRWCIRWSRPCLTTLTGSANCIPLSKSWNRRRCSRLVCRRRCTMAR